MKLRIIATLFTLIYTSINLVGQPLPPTNPNGSPVPIGSIAGILLLIGGFFLMKTKKK